MTKLIFFLALLSSNALAGELPYVSSCTEQDFVTIQDRGEGQAVVVYSNSIEQCSSPITINLTSPNGVSVDLTVEIGGTEKVIVQPVDSQYMSLPPEADIPDGQKQEFLIIGGIG